jgi:peptidoglycan-associated lipoprotein
MNRFGGKCVLAAGVSVALLSLHGCFATQDWVKQQMDPVSAQVSQNDGRLSQVENQVGKLNGRVVKVEGGLGEFQGKLGALDAKTEKALGAIANLKVERRVVVDFKDGANFGVGSANLPPKARKEIDAALSEVKAAGGSSESVYVVVAGHTDSSGSPDQNYELGQKRANAVARYLVSQENMDRSRVIPVSYGESAPLAENSSSQGRAKNRRVEILVYRDGVNVGSEPVADAAEVEPRAADKRARYEPRNMQR